MVGIAAIACLRQNPQAQKALVGQSHNLQQFLLIILIARPTTTTAHPAP
ncbi:hypothetical protein [Thermoleptolyngbya sp.]